MEPKDYRLFSLIMEEVILLCFRSSRIYLSIFIEICLSWSESSSLLLFFTCIYYFFDGFESSAIASFLSVELSCSEGCSSFKGVEGSGLKDDLRTTSFSLLLLLLW